MLNNPTPLSHNIYNGIHILEIPGFPYRILVGRRSHIHSHGGNEMLEILKKIFLNFSKKEIHEIFSENKEFIRFKVAVPDGVKLKNRLVQVDEKSPIFYARRVSSIVNGLPYYRDYNSKLVLNGDTKDSTHIQVILVRYQRPKSKEVVYKIVTAFPTGNFDSLPEAGDTHRIEQLHINNDDVSAFWKNHAISVNDTDPYYEVCGGSIIIPEESKDLIKGILESSGKL